LGKYEIENLANNNILNKEEIVVKELISATGVYTSFIFEHKFDPNIFTRETKTING